MRSAFGSLVLVATAACVVLTPGAASADSCMCVAAQPAWDLEARDEVASFEGGRVLQSVEVGPFFSSDGSTLVSDVGRDRVTRSSRRRAPSRDVLWCASPDDPRCSGQRGPEERGPQLGDGSHAGAGVDDDSRVAPSPRLGVVRPDRDDAVRPGWALRVERPPSR